jgi:hypothetical protein
MIDVSRSGAESILNRRVRNLPTGGPTLIPGVLGMT